MFHDVWNKKKILIFQYDESGALAINPMRHTLEVLGDMSTMNAADLKIRIEEMLRIKVCLSVIFWVTE